MSYSIGRTRHIKQLTARLEASADRIYELQEAILNGIGIMSPREFDRHLDALRAEQVRYGNIDMDLQRMTSFRKMEKLQEKHRLRAKTSMERIKD